MMTVQSSEPVALMSHHLECDSGGSSHEEPPALSHPPPAQTVDIMEMDKENMALPEDFKQEDEPAVEQTQVKFEPDLELSSSPSTTPSLTAPSLAVTLPPPMPTAQPQQPAPPATVYLGAAPPCSQPNCQAHGGRCGQYPTIGAESYFGYVETVEDAIMIVEACRFGRLARVRRRLADKERLAIRSGSVFVFVERESGIRRWTDGKLWSPSRICGEFLLYRELEQRASPAPKRPSSSAAVDEKLIGGSRNSIPSAQAYRPPLPSHPGPPAPKFLMPATMGKVPMPRPPLGNIPLRPMPGLGGIGVNGSVQNAHPPQASYPGAQVSPPVAPGPPSSQTSASQLAPVQPASQVNPAPSVSQGPAQGQVQVHGLVPVQLQSGQGLQVSIGGQPPIGALRPPAPLPQGSKPQVPSGQPLTPQQLLQMHQAMLHHHQQQQQQQHSFQPPPLPPALTPNNPTASSSAASGQAKLSNSINVFKKDGLIKKTISLNIADETYHLICYFRDRDLATLLLPLAPSRNQIFGVVRQCANMVQLPVFLTTAGTPNTSSPSIPLYLKPPCGSNGGGGCAQAGSCPTAKLYSACQAEQSEKQNEEPNEDQLLFCHFLQSVNNK